MKVRSDFVTNSSSSSFIISTKNTDLVNADLFDYIVRNEYDLNIYFSEEYDGEYANTQGEIHDIRAELALGRTVFITYELENDSEDYNKIVKFLEERTTDDVYDIGKW